MLSDMPVFPIISILYLNLDKFNIIRNDSFKEILYVNS